MSARSRATPWFAPTFEERCHQAREDRVQRMAREAIELQYERWMSGENVMIDMANAERFIERRRLWRAGAIDLPRLEPSADALNFYRTWWPVAGDLEADLMRARSALR